jgi:hypothetical protein
MTQADTAFGLAGMVFTLVLAVVVLWQGFKTWQIQTTSRAYIARSEEYLRLAQEATAVQRKVVEHQERLIGDLAELRDRVTAIEKLLREVE